MKRLIISCLALGLLHNSCLAEEKTILETENDKISYSLGYQLGENFKRQGAQINSTMLLKGLDDALSGDTAMLESKQRLEALANLKKQLADAQKQKANAQAEQNLVMGKKFLAENAKKEGVTTLPSGLQYKELSAGTGKTPQAASSVSVHYRGQLIDGKEFDSSYKRNKPSSFQVNKVIKGWTEALQLMREGDKWELFIPPELAYGERGAGKAIPPNSALIFEVELLSIN
jgi:FKBP-type peptidyl-prolyl cis-trans isomerase FklB